MSSYHSKNSSWKQEKAGEDLASEFISDELNRPG